MSSPFPGIDPYLEGYLWPDVHHALANKIWQQLTPKLRPHYAARLNKGEPGLTIYRQERQRLHQGEIHLVELDLLRRGTRPFAHPQMPDVPYTIALTRAHFGVMDVWPLTLQNMLPNIPVPLRVPDPDVILDLSAAIREIYDEAAYDLSLNYTELPPPPALSEADKHWLEALLNS